MKVAGYFPIKLANERFPGKNLLRFDDGTPLMHMTQRALLSCGACDVIHCFCSDENIRDYLLGGVGFLSRPAMLDTPQTRCADIIAAYVTCVEADVYVLAHVTSPFISADTFIRCIAAVTGGEYDSALAVTPLRRFAWWQGQPLNYALNDIPRTQDLPPLQLEASSPYVFTREVWQRHHSRTAGRTYLHEVSAVEALDIDYPEDFELARQLYAQSLKAAPPPQLTPVNSASPVICGGARAGRNLCIKALPQHVGTDPDRLACA